MDRLVTRVAKLEADVLALKSGRSQPPSVELVDAAEMALERLKGFYEHHKREIDHEPDENEDYVYVVSPIPALERALDAVKKTDRKKTKKPIRQ